MDDRKMFLFFKFVSVDKTIIVKSSPQAFQLFGIKNVPKDLVNGKRVEKVSTESPGKDSIKLFNL